MSFARNTAGESLHLQMKDGELLADSLVAAGESITLPCSGRGTCGKCRARVFGALQAPNGIELQHLSTADLAAGLRLVCQARSSGGEVVVHSLPKASDFGILVDGCGDLHLGDSNLRLQRIHLPQALPESLSDWERLMSASNGTMQDESPHLGLLRAVPEVVTGDAQQLEVAHFAERLLCIRPVDHGRLDYYGVAYDIGTTTLVAYLVDLQNREVIGALPRANPQAAHGADVMSRINVASEPEGLRLLHREIISVMEEMASTLASSTQVAPRNIVAMSIVGNTCMHHLCLGLSPTRLGQSPYLPVHRAEVFTTGAALGMDAFPDTVLWSGPLIGGFVGADAVAAAVAGQLLTDDQPRLLVDLGTNGEILLSAHGRIWACSAAAGPAFEGVQILHGMRAEPGAIDGVALSSDGVELHVLGDCDFATGICGSGLIDLVAELVRLDVIDGTGRLRSAAEVTAAGKPELARRVVETARGTAFRLTQEPQTIDFTQADIRQVQLAKGAIRAAIDICCVRAGITASDLDEVLLAGAFGTYIRKDSALRIGLLPSLPLPRIRSLGNAAGAGAVLALVSEAARAACIDLAARAEHVDLGGEPVFQERFMEALFF